MTTCTRLPMLVLVAAAACGFPRPADVGDDAPGDASVPGVTVHVSPAGDDANDGLVHPVKTLKRAIGIAADSSERATIAVAAGRYGAATGELFPITMPTEVTIAGPSGGGAILVGSKSESGIVLGAGKLQNLEIEDFAVAITATGLGEVANVRVRTSGLALREETTAKLTVSNLDITGTSGACAKGIELSGNADLMGADISTRALGTTVLARDQAAVNLTRITVSGDSSCAIAVLDIRSSQMFTLSEGLVDGGYFGATLLTAGMPTQVLFTNVVIRNTKSDVLSGKNTVVKMTGGELSHGGGVGLEISGGSWVLTNVAIKQNASLGIYMQTSTLTMRGCTVTENHGGAIDLGVSAVADLGTISDSGHNTLQSTSGVELYIESTGVAAGSIDAIGNTWKPGVQGADASGMYPAGTVIPGPVSGTPNGNFVVSDQGWNLRL
jgi:hypothetical protein